MSSSEKKSLDFLNRGEILLDILTNASDPLYPLYKEETLEKEYASSLVNAIADTPCIHLLRIFLHCRVS